MFNRLWYLITKIALYAAILLSFLAVIEVLRILSFLRRISPVLSYGVAAVLVIVILWAFIRFIKVWRSYPRVLTPPAVPDFETADLKELKSYARYLMRYLDRLSSNPNLEEEQRALAGDGAADLEDLLASKPSENELLKVIEQTGNKIIPNTLQVLDEKAEKEVRRCVRDVMVGVSVSPFQSLDLVIVLYRNGSMVLRILAIYANRPALAEQALMLRDTLRVVATVNLLHMGRNLIESLFAHVPVIGRAVDDIGQGLGAGLLTSAAGHAAMDRCAAWQGWNREEASERLVAQTKQFLKDVRDIFTRDVFPDLKGMIKTHSTEATTDDPGFWNGIAQGIGKAIDATADTLSSVVVQPAVAGIQGVARAGSTVTTQVLETGNRAVTSTCKGGRKARRGVLRVFRTFGQRMRYGSRIGRFP